MFCPTRVVAPAILALAVLTPTAARAQGAALPTCMTLLPVEALTKILGQTYKDMGSEVGRSGASDCEWATGLGTPTFKTLAFTFFDAVALEASPGYASADEYLRVGGIERGIAGARQARAVARGRGEGSLRGHAAADARGRAAQGRRGAPRGQQPDQGADAGAGPRPGDALT